MKGSKPNDYEKAFANWLIDRRVQYVPVDERKRALLAGGKIKSFDYLIYPKNQQPLIVEVKGRLFKGASLKNLSGLVCWVKFDDIEGLTRWQHIFGSTHTAVFVFAYRLKHIDVDLDGREVFEYAGERYLFFAIRLSDYCAHMKIRNRKWKTVTLSADNFRKLAMPLQKLK